MDAASGSVAQPASAEGPVAAYYCHGCSMEIKPIIRESDSEMVCPTCASEFIEEVEASDPPAQFVPYDSNAAPPLPTAPSPNPPPPQQPLPPPPPPPVQPNIFPFPPIPHMIQHMMSMFHPQLSQANGQPQVFYHTQNIRTPFGEIVTTGTMPGGAWGGGGGGGNVNDIFGMFGMPMGVNPGDYFMGGNMDALLNHLFQNSSHRGTPPASSSAIDKLKKGTIQAGETKGDCAVCKEEFTAGTEYLEMPCTHIFHPECITTWLKIHNSCPVCRAELKTDDADYEATKSQPQAQPQQQTQPPT